jgi:hypothetical protein
MKEPNSEKVELAKQALMDAYLAGDYTMEDGICVFSKRAATRIYALLVEAGIRPPD